MDGLGWGYVSFLPLFDLSVTFTKLQVREWKGLLSFMVGSSLYWGRESWFEESASGIRSFPTLL